MPDKVLDQTLEFYAHNARNYASKVPVGEALRQRDNFISMLPKKARILDLGSGSGHHAAVFLEQGFEVTMIDGSPELAVRAQERTGQQVLVSDFSTINFQNEFDGVWASSSLLHVPSDNLERIFSLVSQALVSGGVFFSSYKISETDWTDKFGRVFGAMNEKRLSDLFQKTEFEHGQITTTTGVGYDGVETKNLWATTRRKNSECKNST